MYVCLQATREGQASFAHVREIIRGLERRGWDVSLFQPGYASTSGRVGILRRLVAFLVVQLRAAGSLVGCDVMYVRCHFGSLLISCLAWIARVPVVQEVNGPYSDAFIAWPGLRWLRWLVVGSMRLQLRIARAVIVVTPGLAAWVEAEIGRGDAVVIPNGADVDVFTPDRDTRSEPVRPYAIFFGALAAWQGIPVLIAAAAHPCWPRDVDLLVVGEGAELERLLAAAASNPALRAVGTKPYLEMPGLIAGALVGLAPMTDLAGRASTGLSPLKVYETLACGVPCIVSDFPGQAELFRDGGCGLVVPPGDAAALAAAVRHIHESPAEARSMGTAGRKLIVAHHSWDARAGATARLLAELVGCRAVLSARVVVRRCTAGGTAPPSARRSGRRNRSPRPAGGSLCRTAPARMGPGADVLSHSRGDPHSPVGRAIRSRRR